MLQQMQDRFQSMSDQVIQPNSTMRLTLGDSFQAIVRYVVKALRQPFTPNHFIEIEV